MSGIKQQVPLFSIDGLGQSVTCKDTADECLEESQREYHGCKLSLIARSIYEATFWVLWLEFWRESIFSYAGSFHVYQIENERGVFVVCYTVCTVLQMP
jgi:hypothetical protein